MEQRPVFSTVKPPQVLQIPEQKLQLSYLHAMENRFNRDSQLPFNNQNNHSFIKIIRLNNSCFYLNLLYYYYCYNRSRIERFKLLCLTA